MNQGLPSIDRHLAIPIIAITSSIRSYRRISNHLTVIFTAPIPSIFYIYLSIGIYSSYHTPTQPEDWTFVVGEYWQDFLEMRRVLSMPNADVGVPPRCAFSVASLGKRLAHGRACPGLAIRSVLRAALRHPCHPDHTYCPIIRAPYTTLGLPPKVGTPPIPHAADPHYSSRFRHEGSNNMTGHSLDFFVLFHQGKKAGQQMDERNEASIFSRILKAKALLALFSPNKRAPRPMMPTTYATRDASYSPIFSGQVRPTPSALLQKTAFPLGSRIVDIPFAHMATG